MAKKKEKSAFICSNYSMKDLRELFDKKIKEGFMYASGAVHVFLDDNDSCIAVANRMHILDVKNSLAMASNDFRVYYILSFQREDQKKGVPELSVIFKDKEDGKISD